jgi:hypothetical protein
MCDLWFRRALMPHQIRYDGVDHRTGESGSEVGVYVDDLPDGATLEVETRHHRYKIAKGGDTQVRISGHPMYCPEPVTVEIEGSTGEGLGLKPGFIGLGMRMIFQHPTYNHTVTTSRVMDIHRVG